LSGGIQHVRCAFVQDLRAGINRLGIPQSSEANQQLGRANANAEIQQPIVAFLSPDAQALKKKSRGMSENLKECAIFKESGRQDLNLRPLRPEGARALVDGVASHVTDSHPLDRSRAGRGVLPDTLAPAGTATIPRGEPLVTGPVALERLLTAAEVAVRLRVCRATAYALCDRGELPHVRVSNAIRITPADLAEFIARTRRHRP